MSEGWIGVDLDGTLAHYDGWQGPMHIGEPVPEMVARVRGWLDAGMEVRVVTARVSEPDSVLRMRIAWAIKKWCETHIGYRLRVTCTKDYDMLELYDDRAVQVEKNTGRLIGHSTRGIPS